MNSDERTLRQATEIRLQRRLSDWADELERLAREQAASHAVLDRGQSVASVMAALDRHAQQVQADVGALLADGGTSSDIAWVGERLAAHLDQAGQRALEQLTRIATGKASPGGLRNRLLNQTSQAKARAQAHLSEIIGRAQAGEGPARKRAAQENSEDELDDRLPLRRRRAFDRDLVELTRAARGSQSPLALAMIDLDHFKRVNDDYGHPVGDEVLLAVAQLVVKRCGGKGRAYRYGGEEIAILLPNYSCEEAQGLAERVRKDIAAQPVGSRALTVTASLGVASFPDQAADETALLAAADAALYRAKHAGRNCVRATEEP